MPVRSARYGSVSGSFVIQAISAMSALPETRVDLAEEGYSPGLDLDIKTDRSEIRPDGRAIATGSSIPDPPCVT